MENRQLSDSEREVWQRFTQDISPAPNKVKGLDESVIPKIEIRDERDIDPYIPQATMPRKDLLPGDTSQISGNSLRQIKRNQSRPDATLDLHGYTQEQALDKFQQFIRQSSDREMRLLRVITGYGKMTGGQGVLRAALPKWVNYPENCRYILSYQQARAQDGGSGAWLLLLRRKERL